MIILTTNHPDKIDEALTRPGRFDFKYEFTYASANVLKEMLKFRYDISEKEITSYCKTILKDGVFSPAEIQSISFKNSTIEACVSELYALFCKRSKV